MTGTIRTADYLGRTLTNETPGSSDATDYLGCGIGDPAEVFPPVPGDETDRLGRALTGGPPEGPS